MWLKSILAPGRPISMYQILPNTWGHLLTPILFWVQVIPAGIYLKGFSWCRGKDIVIMTISITHPRSTWQVDHIQLPVTIFFNNKTS